MATDSVSNAKTSTNAPARASKNEKTEVVKQVRAMDLGLSVSDRTGVVAVLDRVLANAYVLRTKTEKAHWDVVGPQFYSLHKLWEEQYALLSEYIDASAERTRMLGGFPVATLAGFLRHTELAEIEDAVPMATSTVGNLLRDHETVIRSLRQAVDACADEHNDAGTADFLTGMMEGHEKAAWMLRSFLEGESVQSTGTVNGIVGGTTNNGSKNTASLPSLVGRSSTCLTTKDESSRDLRRSRLASFVLARSRASRSRSPTFY